MRIRTYGVVRGVMLKHPPTRFFLLMKLAFWRMRITWFFERVITISSSSLIRSAFLNLCHISDMALFKLLIHLCADDDVLHEPIEV